MKVRIQTYKPRSNVVSTEDTVPFLVRVGGYFIAMGGLFSFALSSMVLGVKSFFRVKQKVYNQNLLNRRYVEVRIKKR